MISESIFYSIWECCDAAADNHSTLDIDIMVWLSVKDTWFVGGDHVLDVDESIFTTMHLE